jgi:hypothetical protein
MGVECDAATHDTKWKPAADRGVRPAKGHVTMARLALVGVACGATFFVVAAAMLSVGSGEWWHGPLGEPRTPLLLYLVLLLGLPTAAAARVAFLAGRRLLDAPTRTRVRRAWRWMSWPVMAGYLLTAAFGCPAVHNALAHSMLAGWIQYGMLTPRCGPELETYVSIPVLPGVVLSYVESGASCGDGAGAFLLHFWNGRHVLLLAHYTTWQV